MDQSDIDEIERLERLRDTTGHADPNGVVGPIFQEWLRYDPFWMLVACSLVNLTHWRIARPVFDWMRSEEESNRDPAWFLEVDWDWLEEHLRPLGLSKRRTDNLIAMARAWIKDRPETRQDIMDLPGCGKYAADSWAIFIEGRTDIVPDDKNLNWYVDKTKELTA